LIDDLVTVFVCTYNSASTIAGCLSSVRSALPRARLVVIDHRSTDGTAAMAEEYGVEIHHESVGLGYARQLALDLVRTEYLAFVDSDVEIVESSFFGRALEILGNPMIGAVVGMAVGHRLAYGLPAGLLVLRSRDFRGRIIPEFIDARETFYLVRHLTELGLETSYLADSMVHHSEFREFKPEWEGANTRLAAGVRPRELVYALKVIVLLSINSRSVKNIVYIPLFYLKFLRGFSAPGRWRKLTRNPDRRVAAHEIHQ
jgi:glycosyltransferase involved in cell wall biosynthesis